MTGWKQVSRFYKSASVTETDDGYGVALDGKPINTPAGKPLRVGSRVLAEVLVEEWEAQTDKIDPSAMPYSKMAATVIDRVSPQRDQVIAITLKFAETDLLCYRASEPEELVALQTQGWQPVVDWAKAELGAEMRTTTGVLPVNQSYVALTALTEVVSALNDHELMAVSSAAAAAGSLLLGLAIYHRHLSPESVGDLALLDETFQMERWGRIREAMARQRAIRREIHEAARYLYLLSG